MDGAVDIARIAAVVRSTKAGLIGLQELDKGWARSGGADQPAALAEHLGMNVLFHPTVLRGDAQYGLGVACAEGLHTELVPLPGRSGGEPRSAVVTHWEGVTFIVTHLSRNAASRAQQTAALADLCRAQKGPVVLMGDLNQTPLRRPLGSPTGRSITSWLAVALGWCIAGRSGHGRRTTCRWLPRSRWELPGLADVAC
jgi:endonuclease/exonuclease/phosphatase family metal-dependent hydrolase